jgi:hypothetical protein
VISFHNTHAYPGCLVTVTAPRRIRAGSDVPVEFSDGAVAHGRCDEIDGDGMVLTVGAYATARGTRIERKTWVLRRDADEKRWKVGSRVKPEAGGR